MRYLIPVAVILAAMLAACSAEVPETSPVMVVQKLEGDHLWDVNEAASSVSFTATQEGVEFTGRFTEFDVQVNLDPEDTSDAAILATIDLSSVQTGDAERDEALPTRDWFDIKSHPVAVFRADEVVRSNTRDGKMAHYYTAIGTLSLKGVEQPVRLGFTLESETAGSRAVGQVTLDRQDFGVGSGAYDTDQWIAFPVDVDVEIVATKR